MTRQSFGSHSSPEYLDFLSLYSGFASPEESDGLDTPFLGGEDTEASYISHAQRQIFSIHRPTPLSSDSIQSLLFDDRLEDTSKKFPDGPADPFSDYNPFEVSEEERIAQIALVSSSPVIPPPSPEVPDTPSLDLPDIDYETERQASRYSPRFETGHLLNDYFVAAYQLEDELGAGGYGFVMTAKHRTEGYEVAVKFIIKKKVPDYAWMEDEAVGRVPTEVMLLSCIDHESIVKCIDLYDDDLYFYMVQELHGSPWPKAKRPEVRSKTTPKPLLIPLLPLLSHNDALDSPVEFDVPTPPQPYVGLPIVKIQGEEDGRGLLHMPQSALRKAQVSLTIPTRPTFTHRPSHDLFECIEQSPLKRLSEKDAKYIFRQVVDAVSFLDTHGITHRDVKDENCLISASLRVKLIDFGSAVVEDVSKPRPYYDTFFGTSAYASSEILQKKAYQAAPAEIWTLGVLLSFLMTGMSPFPHEKDAIRGRIIHNVGVVIPDACMSLMRHCLDPNPSTRYTIAEVSEHRWLAEE